jgi:predicted Zn-dependent protease
MKQKRKIPMRLLIMGGFILFSVVSYYMKTQKNPVTGEKQRVAISPEQEVAMGLQSAPQMAAQFGGLYNDENVQREIRQIGQHIVASTHAANSPYKFNFYVLADERTINAFALPGGQIFITAAMLAKLKSKDAVASVLGHEIAHVIHRHSAEQMAQKGLLNGIIQGVAMGSGTMNGGQIANYVGQMVNMKYGRDDELESDEYGVKYCHQAGYDARAALEVMEVLAEASGGANRSDFNSTHPNPANRIEKIKEHLANLN